jgi:hypothetical protein
LNDDVIGLLTRIAVALERNADYTEFVRGCYERRERDHELARQRVDADEAESRANTERMLRAQEETAAQQKLIAGQQADILNTYRQHIADCEQWHKKAAGVRQATETVQ